MQYFETIIVGGGPAGSSCAWGLKKQGKEVLILEKQIFPRVKLCAGWITEKVLDDLEVKLADYPHPILEMKVKSHLPLLPFSLPCFPTRWINYSIRRVEFDDWLLKRSGAPVVQHHVKKIRKEADVYIIDNQYSCKFLVGAGGTMCPVRRTFFPDIRNKDDQIATLEYEFEYPARDKQCHLFFFFRSLRGYAWYVPKGDGYVNIGLGGMSSFFKRSGTNIHSHYQQFLADLVEIKLLDASVKEQIKDKGHPYYLFSYEGEFKKDQCFLIGDSAGLASIDLGEGIGPSIESGMLAAEEISGLGVYLKENTSRFSLGGILHWFFEGLSPGAKSAVQE
ncbi:MAG: NAD(P)/FAD-dependent oxidoreductase [SAR324 cluster bacterium]|nr:NAD(P)/FAD-dependent oxidoreductase [SAR324 cluster bacterium]